MPEPRYSVIQPYEFSSEELSEITFTDLQYKYMQTLAWQAIIQLATTKRQVISDNGITASLQEEAYLRGRLEAYLFMLGQDIDAVLDSFNLASVLGDF